MKYPIFKCILLAALVAGGGMAMGSEPYYVLKVNVANILIGKGKLYVGVYNNSKSFDNDNYCAGKVVNVKGGTASVAFKLPRGTYAVKMYQDTNDDNKMNNIFGVPLEPYGVSGNANGFPSFGGACFTLFKNKQIRVNLKN